MTGLVPVPRSEIPDRPQTAAAISEELLIGSRRLREAFVRTSIRFAARNAPLIRAGETDPRAVMIQNGFALRSCVLPDGRRAVLDILLSGDLGSLDSVVLSRAIEDITAVDRVGYHVLGGAALRELMADRCIALQIMALLASTRWRGDRLAASIGRMDAQARICVLLLDIYDRLRRQGLIARPTFNLPLTQEQIADHLGLTLVHVNRTLRRLREEKLVLVDRQVVIIMDIDRLRAVAQGLPQPAELFPAPVPIVPPARG